VSRQDSYARGAGWLTFAATMIGLTGTFNVIDGIVALSRSKFYATNAVYVFSDLRTWGWITLIVGAVQVLAAFAILGGASWARWFGIAISALNVIGQLMFVQAYPLWAITVVALDVLVIYALAVYGGRDVA
jgi:hypothetical protein